MENLSRRLAQGDPAAFAALYDACADRVHHYLVVRLGSREDADDVLQETFVRLARNRRRLAGVDNLMAYVFTVARNEAARLARRSRRAGCAGRENLPAAEDLFCEAGGDLRAQKRPRPSARHWPSGAASAGSGGTEGLRGPDISRDCRSDGRPRGRSPRVIARRWPRCVPGS